MAEHGTCTSCHLPTNVPEHLPPPDNAGMCAACAALRKPGMVERIATNAMPACFTPTREGYVRLAALTAVLQATVRGMAATMENMNGADCLYDDQVANDIAQARAIAGEAPRG